MPGRAATLNNTAPFELSNRAARPGGSVLICAVSGLGKTTLASRHASTVFDADTLLYDAVRVGFPKLEPRARLRAWRRLCRSRPWEEEGEAHEQWALVRRSFHEPFVDLLRGNRFRLVVTSLLHPPWLVGMYYGIARGHYTEHLRLAGRESDNFQDEALNRRLDGYAPLTRLEPGEFLSDRPELRALVTRSKG